MGNQPRYPSAGLVPYDPAWPVRYVELAGSLQQVLGDHWQVEHIGSTSVPGLLAKPVIDLAVRIPEQETVHDNLRAFATARWTGMTPLPHTRHCSKSTTTAPGARSLTCSQLIAGLPRRNASSPPGYALTLQIETRTPT
jgi:GrpB-like predicted nucleotidyltransferase (UPF0157 family)